MTTTNTQHRAGARAARYVTFCLLALLAVLCQSRQTQAQWTTTGTNTTTNGNVGVGTTAPEASVHVSTASIGVGSRGIIDEQTSNDANGSLLILRKSRAGAAVLNGDIIGNLYAAAFDGTSWVNGTSRVRFLVDGTVTAGAVPTAMQFLTGTNGTTATERMRITSAGNIGIGTTAPGTMNGVNLSAYVPLHIQGTDARFIVVDSATSESGIVLNDSSQAVDNRIWGMSQAAGGGKLTFSTYTDSGSNSDKVVIDRSGKVGIGTTAPTTALHVVGDITVSGNINAKYQDVAEWVPTLHAIPAGTVVILDTSRDNHVTASIHSYDTRVAGVISAQPGLTLGERGEGKALVATTGRVKVKVDATRAPIKVGDLLVTSDVAGVAMRSQPLDLGGVPIHRPGTLIGKALESLDKGTGEILVLLSLQ
ncbi:MAG TPA: hypothetical protein VM934_11785 [Pyrinomonadaceae bacterium]|jgi:hypothetical protein|nr:hypothetical protein [Pyrinomonadaceae bacterium]